MGIIQFIILCVVLGVIVWLVNTYAPIPQQIKTLILVAVVVVLLLILLQAMGIFSGADVPIPKVR
jgi:uncharacterized protein YhhL (DUF1145 family)